MPTSKLASITLQCITRLYSHSVHYFVNPQWIFNQSSFQYNILPTILQIWLISTKLLNRTLIKHLHHTEKNIAWACESTTHKEPHPKVLVIGKVLGIPPNDSIEITLDSCSSNPMSGMPNTNIQSHHSKATCFHNNVSEHTLENPDINYHGGYMQMTTDKRAGGAWCSAMEYNGDKLGCFLSQMTPGVLMIWMAGALQALMDGGWWQGWTGCGGVTGKGGSWRWSWKGVVGTFGFTQAFSPSLSLYSSVFFLCLCCWQAADWLSGGDETWVHHALCGLGPFFPPLPSHEMADVLVLPS